MMIRLLNKAIILGFLGIVTSVLFACDKTTSTTTSLSTITTTSVTTTTLSTTSESTTTTTLVPKTVPVFQSIEVTGLTAYSSLYKRPLHGEPSIDPIDPFGDLDDGTIEDVLAENYPFPEEEILNYYANANETVYLILQFDNPDQLNIPSFELNGIEIPSSAFTLDANAEQIVYEFEMTDVPGIYYFSVNAFKYDDTLEVKEVLLSQNNVVQIGVASEQPAVISVTNVFTTATGIVFDVTIPADDVLWETYYAVLYDGTSLVRSMVLTEDHNGVAFQSLEINTLYQYAIFRVMNLLDGEGYQLQLDVKEAFFTETIVSVDGIVATSDSVSFELTINDDDYVGFLFEVALMKGQEPITTIANLDILSFSNLLSDTEYSLEISYAYNLQDGLGTRLWNLTIRFKTLAKTSPTVVIGSVVNGQEQIAFAIEENDPDDIAIIQSVELLLDDVVVQTLTTFDVLEFSDLLSNKTYTLRATFLVDYHNGLPAVELIDAIEVTTLAKTVPLVELVTTPGIFGFSTNWVDTDETSQFVKAELYLGDVFVKELDATLVTGELLSNTLYTLKLTYAYDLNDGLGLQEVIIMQTSMTEAKEAPSVQLLTILKEPQKLGIEFYFTDEDSVMTETPMYRVYQGATNVKIGYASGAALITNLLSATWYEIVVSMIYDLNDGTGVHTLDTTFYEKTNAVTIPVAQINILDITSTHVDFSVSFDDVDHALLTYDIELYYGATLVQSYTTGSNGTFGGLLANTEYDIRVTVHYDPMDGTASLEKTYFISFRTQAS